MMKKIRKWRAVWLSLVMALSMAVPALAAPAASGAVLNVRFAPNGIGVNSTTENPIVYTAYRIADISVDPETGSFQYTPTPAFADAGINIDGILKGAQANENIAACRRLMAAFGSYINENGKFIRENGGNDVLKAETKNTSIGVNNKPTDGVAQFTNLKDGLYLISTNASVRMGDTRFTPYPLLIGIPYIYDGVTNHQLTATAKFYADMPTASYDPPAGTSDTPDTTNTPAASNMPASPVTPAAPVTPPAFENIPMENVPLAEPEVDILEMDVPLADMLDNAEEPELEILDTDVPLSYLPQTGLLWWPVPVMAAAGMILVISGVLVKRRTVRDE